jgi:NADP-dependent 3-hydroxy acid dehydrogenase YdfG
MANPRTQRVALASRRLHRLQPLADRFGALSFAVDASRPADTQRWFNDVDQQLGSPELVLFNPTARMRGAFVALDVDEVSQALQATAIAAFVKTGPPRHKNQHGACCRAAAAPSS